MAGNKKSGPSRATRKTDNHPAGRGALKLSAQEKRGIIERLEADRPLPDKYRFLLFDEKREVELVWNGKTGEVCNLVLPFQVVLCKQ